MEHEPRLVIASLVPFEKYVKARFTGKTWIVEYDGKKILFRSSLLPRPEEPMERRISRVGLRKKGYSKSVLRGIAKEFFETLPNDERSYRFLLRLSKLRKKGLRYDIDRKRSEIARAIGHITPKLIGKLMRKYNAKAYEIIDSYEEPSEPSREHKIIDLGKKKIILYF